MKNRAVPFSNWFVAALFASGWLFTFGKFQGDALHYLVLNVLSFAAAWRIAWVLRGRGHSHLHLWVVFWLYLLGYYAKYYLLCYMSTVSGGDAELLLEGSYPREAVFFEDRRMLLDYVGLATACLCTFALVVEVIMRRQGAVSALNLRARGDAPGIGDGLFNAAGAVSRLNGLFMATLGLSALVFVLEWTYGVGINDGAEREAVVLPFRLAGVIVAVHNALLPLLYLMLIWLSGALGLGGLYRRIVSSYLLFGVIGGLLTTSKSAMTVVIASLYVLWFVTGNLKRKDVLWLLAAVPALTLFNTFLSLNRVLRGLNADQDVMDILSMVASQWLSSSGPEGSEGFRLLNYLGLLLRINGVDSVLNMMDFHPAFSFERLLQIVVLPGPSVASLYATDVLGVLSDVGVAFSPSLLGYFYFIGAGVLASCIGLALFLILVEAVFKGLRRAGLLIEPILVAILSIQLALATSEGTLEVVPLRLAIVAAAAVAGEFMVLRLLRLRRGGTLQLGSS